MELGTHKLIATSTVVGATLVIATLERLFPYQKGQKLFRKHFITDWIWYSIIFSLLMGMLVADLISPGIDSVTHLTRLQLVTSWPIWLQMLFFLITHELVVYWFHRAMHANKYLWRIHEAHHSAREVDWAAGSRAHVIEAIILTTAEFAPIYLLGAAPEVAIYKGVIDAIWGMYIHSNINVREGWLQYIINGPEMHRWHHSRDVHDINFATKLAIWDWLFKTAYLPDREKPERYGIELEWPRNIVTQQTVAFRPFDENTQQHEEQPRHRNPRRDRHLVHRSRLRWCCF